MLNTSTGQTLCLVFKDELTLCVTLKPQRNKCILYKVKLIDVVKCTQYSRDIVDSKIDIWSTPDVDYMIISGVLQM